MAFSASLNVTGNEPESQHQSGSLFVGLLESHVGLRGFAHRFPQTIVILFCLINSWETLRGSGNITSRTTLL